MLLGVIIAALPDAQAVTLRYAPRMNRKTLDPIPPAWPSPRACCSNVFEGLVGATRISSWCRACAVMDPARYADLAIQLRPDVKFHDGSPFSADDVVFSLERVLSANSQMKSTVQGVGSARKIDNQRSIC